MDEARSDLLGFYLSLQNGKPIHKTEFVLNPRDGHMLIFLLSFRSCPIDDPVVVTEPFGADAQHTRTVELGQVSHIGTVLRYLLNMAIDFVISAAVIDPRREFIDDWHLPRWCRFFCVIPNEDEAILFLGDPLAHVSR